MFYGFIFCFLQKKTRQPTEAAHSKGKVTLRWIYLTYICSSKPSFAPSVSTLSCFIKQNLMDLRSLQHIVGLTEHDRTSKSIFHPHWSNKPPTVSAQFQVCLLCNFAELCCSHSWYQTSHVVNCSVVLKKRVTDEKIVKWKVIWRCEGLFKFYTLISFCFLVCLQLILKLLLVDTFVLV